ncbi:hypothetical protein MMC06_005089 [Schaereria dolodes]|nr:hypothetical protein [Schaereria dolodes]
MATSGDNMMPLPAGHSHDYQHIHSPNRKMEEEISMRESSKENMASRTAEVPIRRKLPSLPTDSVTRVQGSPLSLVHLNEASDIRYLQASSAEIATPPPSNGHSFPPSNDAGDPRKLSTHAHREENYTRHLEAVQQVQAAPSRPISNARSDSPRIVTPETARLSPSEANIHQNPEFLSRPSEHSPSLQYHHQNSVSEGQGVPATDNRASRITVRSSVSYSPSSSSIGENVAPNRHQTPNGRLTPGGNNYLGAALPRPPSTFSNLSEMSRRGRTRSPQFSPSQYPRGPSAHSGRSPDSRPMSYVDLLNVPYPQPAPAPANLENMQLRTAVGSNASLLSTMKTLEMYRANVRKTNDPAVQYEFAVFMISAAQEAAVHETGEDFQRRASPSIGSHLDGTFAENPDNVVSQIELLREARHILQKLSDRSYPFAQYYLADGYASGLFGKGKQDDDRAFPLFVAASKHGHAEAGYRTALCYEFGWGARKDPQKAVQFYRQSASKNHPGAMSRLARACLAGDMGLVNRYREGLKWLKRAAESADFQYNSAPYDLGLLHETGYGEDVFQDESYAAQLFTQSADLGHAEASYRLGDAYEHGKLNCPRDPALSVHFYTGAAQRGHPLAMMALCAWYMVGAEPVLDKDENEAYEWAKKAAESGLPKAEYAVGYFTEMGIGCRRDPLEANVWYVKAADDGDERATFRIAAIRAAASGESTIASAPVPSENLKKGKTDGNTGGKEAGEKGKARRWVLF